MKANKKVIIPVVAAVCAASLVGGGLGVKTYQRNQEIKAEEAAENKEYASMKTAYKDAEQKIKYSIFEDSTNKGNTEAQEALRKKESDKLLSYKKKISDKTMSDQDKKAYKKLLKEVSKKYQDSASFLSEVSASILAEDTASLGEYYTDDLKTKDTSSKADFEKAQKAGDYQTAYNCLTAISNNFATATNNKAAAEQAAAEQKAAEEKAATESAAAETKKNAKNKGKNGGTTTAKNGTKNGTNNSGAAANNDTANGSTNTSSGKDWKHSPIDYSHYYKKDEVPDGYHVAAAGPNAGVPLKNPRIGITMQEAQALMHFHPERQIIDQETPLSDGTTSHKFLTANGTNPNVGNEIID
ncbi:MAG: hypothetical protein PUB40_05775 [Lachnospiraceae bacterium]|nr:hypothetical protein [Lachnospiraceae bacterium]